MDISGTVGGFVGFSLLSGKLIFKLTILVFFNFNFVFKVWKSFTLL